MQKRKKDSARLVWDSKPKRAPSPKDIEFQTAEIVIPNPQKDQTKLPLHTNGGITEYKIEKEKMNRQIRKVTKNKGSFPTDDALFKLLYLAVIDASKKWTMPIREWGVIINQLRIYYGEHIDIHL